MSLYTTDLDGRGEVLPWRHPRHLTADERDEFAPYGVTTRYFKAEWPTRYAFSRELWQQLETDVSSFDVVHIHSLYLFHTLAAAVHSRRANVPYVIRPHGTLDEFHRQHHRWRKAPYWHLIEQRNVRHASALHYTSEFEKRSALDAGVRTRGFVVPQGIDAGEYGNLPARGRFRHTLGYAGRHPLVVFLGRITPKKGLDLLVPAFADATRDGEGRLLIAGPDDEAYAGKIRELAHRHGVDDRVHWLGMVSGRQKLELLRDTDVWALPSYDESFGIAAVEAMAAGAPVLLSNRVGIAVDAQRSGAALVVDPDISQVAHGLSVLLRNESLRTALGESGRRFALANFSWDAVAKLLSDRYGELLHDVRPARVQD